MGQSSSIHGVFEGCCLACIFFDCQCLTELQLHDYAIALADIWGTYSVDGTKNNSGVYRKNLMDGIEK